MFVAIVITDSSQIEKVLEWSFSQPRPFLIVDSARLDQRMSGHLIESGFEIIPDVNLTQDISKADSPHNLFIMTSGTTGQPKIVKHAISSLNTFRNVGQLEPATWFVPAPIGSFAWYQMIFLRREIEDQRLILTNSRNLLWDFEVSMRNRTATAISCTPTFLRYVSTVLDAQIFRDSSVRRVTLGGEVISESDLRLALDLFPNVRINHIYAATEFGPIFTSNDNLPGYSMLRYKNNVDFKIDAGMLYVRNRLVPGTLNWFETGDYAVCEGNRIYILGRFTRDFINVGGNRVSLKKVEEVISHVPQVQFVEAYGVNSRLMGNVVGVRVVTKDLSLREQIEANINACCYELLSDFEIPCEILITDNFQIKESLKK